MNPREIIAQAWVYTMKEGGMRRWGFAASFFETLLSVQLASYQSWLFYSYIKGTSINYLALQRQAVDQIGFTAFISILVTLGMIWVGGWLFPHLARGAIIGLAAKCHRKEAVEGGLVLGVYNFFSIFAVHQLLILSGITTVISLISLALRFGGSIAPVVIIAVLLLWSFTLILEFFWIFSEEAIVIHKIGVRPAIRKSVKLVISHLGHIVFLMLLLFFIILRIVGNLIMVILIPGITIALGFTLTQLLSPIVSYSIAGVLGVLIVGIASYFFAYIDVFRQTVWTLTYMELSKLKELDIIEEI